VLVPAPYITHANSHPSAKNRPHSLYEFDLDQAAQDAAVKNSKMMAAQAVDEDEEPPRATPLEVVGHRRNFPNYTNEQVQALLNASDPATVQPAASPPAVKRTSSIAASPAAAAMVPPSISSATQIPAVRQPSRIVAEVLATPKPKPTLLAPGPAVTKPVAASTAPLAAVPDAAGTDAVFTAAEEPSSPDGPTIVGDTLTKPEGAAVVEATDDTAAAGPITGVTATEVGGMRHGGRGVRADGGSGFASSAAHPAVMLTLVPPLSSQNPMRPTCKQ